MAIPVIFQEGEMVTAYIPALSAKPIRVRIVTLGEETVIEYAGQTYRYTPQQERQKVWWMRSGSENLPFKPPRPHY